MTDSGIEVYITRLGDTISGLATQFADTCDPDEIENYQQKLIKANRGDLRLRRFLKKTGVIRPLPAFSAIIIPSPQEHPDFVSKIQRKGMQKAQHIINTSTAEERHSFAKLLYNTDIDLERLGVALQLASNISESANPDSDKGNGLIGELASGTMTLGDAGSGYYGERVRLFHNSLSNVSDKVDDYLKAPGSNKAAAKQAYLDAHMEMNERFNREIDSIIGKRRPRTQKRHFLRNANRFANKTRSSRRPFIALDTEDIIQYIKRGPIMKIINRSCSALQFSVSATHVVNTYRDGGNWQKEAFTESAGLLAGSATAASMLSTAAMGGPPVLCIFLIAGATYYAGKAASQLASSFWDQSVRDIEAGARMSSFVIVVIGAGQAALKGESELAAEIWQTLLEQV